MGFNDRLLMAVRKTSWSAKWIWTNASIQKMSLESIVYQYAKGICQRKDKPVSSVALSMTGRLRAATMRTFKMDG